MTTRAELPNKRFGGRPVKPLALGLIPVTSVVAINQWWVLMGHAPLLLTPNDSRGAVALASTLCVLGMVLSWVGRWQTLYRMSLLLCMAAWVDRGFALALDADYFSAVLPLSVAIMVGGSYVLESLDTTPRQWAEDREML